MTKESLNASYSRSFWEREFRKLLPDSYERHGEAVPLEESVYRYVQAAHLFGVVEEWNHTLLVLEVRHSSENDTRVGVFREIRKILSRYDATQALCVIGSENADFYRLSYISFSWRENEKGGVVKESSNPRRYSYLLGAGQKVHTPASNLRDEIRSLSDLRDRFALEVVSKRFFDRYKELYLDFVGHLESTQGNLFRPRADEDTGKRIRDFCKKMMSRLVFLKFMEKKRWLGCAKEWGDGAEDFLMHYFAQTSDKGDFYRRRLVPLFYKALNTDRRSRGDLFKFDGTSVKIPYLNGGLFERDARTQEIEGRITFPAESFRALFEFFNEYNFTIDESQPDDVTVAVDPEMLGNIFENLLEDNKDKGAFYTPKEIVRYMCRESLIEYLDEKLNQETRDPAMRREIERLVREHQVDAKLEALKTETVKCLKSIKICDPAIGSGAFPMGMLQEILNVREILEEGINRLSVKEEIIHNNIYGVDIEPGAVEIARLRFWLSLVVDEKEPRPLPNLDYRIMQGNSLLENFEGIPLYGKKAADLYSKKHSAEGFMDFGEKEQESIANRRSYDDRTFIDIINGHFSESDPVKKENDRRIIQGIEREHIKEQILCQIDKLRMQLENLKGNARQQAKKEAVVRKRLSEMTASLKRAQELKPYQKPYFLWHLYFGDVMDAGGFDVVIGNPPYVQLQRMGGKADFLKNEFQTYAATGDIYALFYELSGRLLVRKGTLALITSNKWMRANYGRSLREYLTSKITPIRVIDLGANVFQAATVDTNILFGRSEIPEKASLKFEASGINVIDKPLDEMEFVPIAVDGGDAWTILSRVEQSIKEKVEREGTPLGEWDVRINRGILTGYNDAFIIDTRQRDELVAADPKCGEIIKPLLRGKDIRRYHPEWAGKWLIATLPSKQYTIKKFPAIHDYLKGFGKRLSQTGKPGCRKRTGNKWFETQDQIVYWQDFEKEKVIWGEICTHARFAYDSSGSYLNNTTLLMTAESDLKYLLGITNSSLLFFSFKTFYSGTVFGSDRKLGERIRFQKEYVLKLPVIRPSAKQREAVMKLVEGILSRKELGDDTSDLEKQIDRMVYQLYGLSDEEIAVVEGRCQNG